MSAQKKIYLPDGSSYVVGAASLAGEQATPTVTGVRSPWGDSVASGLDPKRLARILRESEAQGGETRDYLQLLEDMEEREPHYRSQLMTRKLAIRGLEPQVEATAETGEPVRIADEMRGIVRTPRFRRMIVDLLDGISKGYSVVEIIWDLTSTLWRPKDYKHRDPRWFQYDRDTGRELRLREEGNHDGLALEPAKFIVFEPKLKSGLPIRGGLGRTIVWLFLLKSFTVQDWMTFLDVYGIPIRVGKWQPGASEADKRTLLRAVSNMVSDAAVTIPSSMVIEILEAKASGTDAHLRAAEFWNKEISKVVVGQTMTAEDGASLAQAEVHDRVRLDIAEADADDVADAIQIGLIEPYCALNYGLQPEDCPQLRLPVPKPKDMTALMDVTEKFVRLGGKVSMSEARDEIGWSDPGDDELLGAPAAPPVADPTTVPPAADPTPPALNHSRGCTCGCQRLALNRLSLAPGPIEVESLVPDDWEEINRPLIEPVLAAVSRATSYEEALAVLAQAGPDGTALAAKLASLTAIARGIGDVKD